MLGEVFAAEWIRICGSSAEFVGENEEERWWGRDGVC
jgi:hypothetical protein